MNFKLIKTQIDDVKIFQPDKFEDSRGYLIESYKEIFFDALLKEQYLA